MPAYLIQHHNGDLYERSNETLLDDLSDMVEDSIDKFMETDDVKFLFTIKVSQYRNSESIDDHRPATQVFTGVKEIVNWASSRDCAAHQHSSNATFNLYKALKRRVNYSWEEWMTDKTIG